jgi:peptidoglycan/xylan/chitin deacetylase (PgdA/CDA1 family)
MPLAGPYAPPADSRFRRFARSARERLFLTSDRLGVNAAIAQSRWRQERLLILCYHGVSILDEHLWDELFVSPELLDRRLRWLRRHKYAILPLDEAVERLYAGELPPKAVALTFDDGLHDFSARAMPVLGAHSAPATVYVTTFYVAHRLPVFNPTVSYLMWKGAGREFSVPGMGQPLRAPAREDRDARNALRDRIIAHRDEAGVDVREQHAWLEQMASALRVDFTELMENRILQLMTPGELAGLDRSLVDLQLHTHRHRTPKDRDLFQRELDDNRQALAPFGDTDGLRHFCYPSGQYTAEQVQWLAENGVVSATTCDPGLATRASRPLLLPRLIDSELLTDAKFGAWASGTGALLSSAAR